MLVSYRWDLEGEETIVIVVLQDPVAQTEQEALRLYTYSDTVSGNGVELPIGEHDRWAEEHDFASRIS